MVRMEMLCVLILYEAWGMLMCWSVLLVGDVGVGVWGGGGDRFRDCHFVILYEI